MTRRNSKDQIVAVAEQVSEAKGPERGDGGTDMDEVDKLVGTMWGAAHAEYEQQQLGTVLQSR